MKKYQTDQENFWAGDFGTQYIKRNKSSGLLAANLSFFSRALSHADKISSCLEFGANIGMNCKAVKLLVPGIKLRGIEINKVAAAQLSKVIGAKNVYVGSILDYPVKEKADLTLTKGLLIHINPDKLDLVYRKLYEASAKYLLMCEYYNPFPVTVPYSGHKDRLFKRDFAGELLDKYPDLRLIDYGFCYRRDAAFPQDDTTWFLLEKQNS